MLPEGPWTTEKDELSWEHHGMQCYICRGPLWNLNGYVGIEKTNPLYGIEAGQPSEKLKELVESRKEDPIDDTVSLGMMIDMLSNGDLSPTPESILKVHFGVTYSGDHKPLHEPDGFWWFGFDTNHYTDLSPGLLYFSPDSPLYENNTYRDLAFVQEQTEKLAKQLAELEGLTN